MVHGDTTMNKQAQLVILNRIAGLRNGRDDSYALRGNVLVYNTGWGAKPQRDSIEALIHVELNRLNNRKA